MCSLKRTPRSRFAGFARYVSTIIGFFDIGFSNIRTLPGLGGRGVRGLWVHPNDHRVVGSYLATARRRANLTQQELAGRVGKPQSFVSDYERGQRRLDMLEFLVIARALGRKPSELFEQIMQGIEPSD